jgi:tRNA A-37 threonylcarbamoyl transferase component Bud32
MKGVGKVMAETRAESEHDPLDDILAEYMLRADRGDAVDREQFIAQYPDFSDRLQAYFADASAIAAFVVESSPDKVAPPIRPLLAGQIIGDYELLEKIGEGGMGVVFKARQQSLSRIVAVKMISSKILSSPLSRERFFREAKAAANLQHPNIVRIHEAGKHEGQCYYSMDYVDGWNLEELVRENPLAGKRAASYLLRVARAIHYAHERGTLHRDIKPSNILIDVNDEPHVADFGLARQIDVDPTLSEGGVVGSPAYMSPEQIDPGYGRIGPAGDVYGLGATLYDLLCGRPPFRADTPVLTLHQVLHSEVVSPRLLNSAIERDLETICLKCLEKDSARRYPSAEALAADLGCYLRGEPIQARPVTRLEHFVRWCKRNRLVAGLIGAVAAMLLLLVVVSTTSAWRQARLRQEQDADHAAALVSRLLDAEVGQVPVIVAEIRNWRGLAEPLLRASLAEAAKRGDARKQLLASLAMLETDPSRARYLYERLLDATPDELSVICRALQNQNAIPVDDLWRLAQDASEKVDRRFRAACVLANCDPNNHRWEGLSSAVAEQLVGQNVLLVNQWKSILRPKRGVLVAPLSVVFHDQSQDRATKRALATAILIDYAADRLDVLCELLLDADVQQFAALLPALENQAGHVVARLGEELAGSLPSTANEKAQDNAARRRANAGIALLRLGATDLVWPLMKRNSDPSARNYLVHLVSPLKVAPERLIRQWRIESDSGIRAALVLSLGELSAAEIPGEQRHALIGEFLKAYRNDADSGVHAAIEWTLKRWNEAGKIRHNESRSAENPKGRNGSWYVDQWGHTMVAIPGPVEFAMGAEPSQTDNEPLETSVRMRIARTFAIASKEVTKRQYERFLKDHPEMRRTVERRFAGGSDSPVKVKWYEAAAYCRWLSEQEGLPETQMCFPRIPDIKVGWSPYP